MEMLEGILKSLEIDQSLFYQFGIFVVIFMALHHVFLVRLQEVLEVREERTTKLEEGAGQKFAEVEKLADRYDQEIAQANRQAQESYNEHKGRALEEGKKRLKESEEKLGVVLREQLQDFEKELEKGKDALLGQVDGLSDQLVKKFTDR